MSDSSGAAADRFSTPSWERPKPEEDYTQLGLLQRYIIQHTDGSAVDPDAKYFVLRYDGKGDWVAACRSALLYLSVAIKESYPQLSNDLFRAVMEEGKRSLED